MLSEKQESIFNTNAALLRQLNKELADGFRNRYASPEHVRAAERFKNEFDALAFPGGLTAGLQRLKAFDPQTVSVAIRYLEADPWYFRSGYVKEEILDRLKHADLSPDQRRRLAALVVRSITSGAGRVFKHYARLAPHLRIDSLADDVRAIDEGDPIRRWRRGHVLRLLGA